MKIFLSFLEENNQSNDRLLNIEKLKNFHWINLLFSFHNDSKTQYKLVYLIEVHLI